jgi:autotransporter-associated beta strand protein
MARCAIRTLKQVRNARSKKRNRLCLGAAFLLALLITAVSVPSASAQQNLTWDVNGAAAGTGGSGTWDTTSAFWHDGAAFQTWNNAALDNAIFGGTAGNIVLGTPVTVHDMTFNVGGYLFTTAGTITFGGINPTITTNVGTTQLFPALGGSTGFTKNGPATLQLGGISTGYTGVTTLNEGRLVLSSTLALGFSTAADRLVLNNGTTLSISTPPLTYNYTLTGGTVNVELNLSTWSGVPTLTAPTTVILSGANTAGTLSGNLADTGADILSLTRNSTGRVTLSGNNSYTGATTVTRGTLQLGRFYAQCGHGREPSPMDG